MSTNETPVKLSNLHAALEEAWERLSRWQSGTEWISLHYQGWFCQVRIQKPLAEQNLLGGEPFCHAQIMIWNQSCTSRYTYSFRHIEGLTNALTDLSAGLVGLSRVLSGSVVAPLLKSDGARFGRIKTVLSSNSPPGTGCCTGTPPSKAKRSSTRKTARKKSARS
jgi:hypothetical protein